MKVADLVAELGFETDTSGLKKFEGGVDKAGVSTVAFGSLVSAGITKLAQLGAAAIKAAAAFAIDLVTGLAETGDEIAKTSKQIGVNAQQLQRLRFAAERSGVSTSSLDKALKKLQVGLIDARDKGTGPAIEGLELLGLTFEDLEGIDTETQLGVIATAMNELGQEADKTSALAKLFGERSGVELKTLLLEGADGIRELGDRAEELGGVLGDTALADAESFTDAMTDLDTLWEGLKNRLGAELIPRIESLIERFTEWIQENEKLLDQDLGEFLDVIVDALEVAIPFLVEIAVETKNLFTEIKQLDERLTEDFGPAWDIIKFTVKAVLFPLLAFVDVIQFVVNIVGDAINSLLEMDGVIGSIARTIRDAAAALGIFNEKTVTTRGLTTLGAGETVTIEGGPGAGKGAVGGKIDQNTSVARLTQIAESGNVSDSKRAQAEAFLVPARQREAGEAAAAGVKANDERITRERIKARDRQERDQLRAASKAKRDEERKKRDAKGKAKGRAKATKKKDEPAEVTGIPELDQALAALDVEGEAKGTRLQAGGGGKAGTGTTINRIDQSFNAPTTIEVVITDVELPEGLDPETVAQRIGEAISVKLQERDRAAADHFQSVVSV